jgi:hypothetical protein
MAYNFQSPPTVPSLVPTPASPNSCMAPIMFQSEKDIMNKEEESTENDIVKLLVNLDDLFQDSPSGQHRSNDKSNKNEDNKSKPLPPKSNRLVGSGATLNDVKAITSSLSNNQNNGMSTHYYEQQPQPQSQSYQSSSLPVHPNYNGYSVTSLSPQNIYGNHMMQQQPYHPQYYPSQASY